MEAILQLRPYLGKENFFLNWDLFFFSLFLFERLGMVVSCLRSDFIILYRLCYKLRQCKPGSVYFYIASLAFKKKKSQVLGLLAKEITWACRRPVCTFASSQLWSLFVHGEPGTVSLCWAPCVSAEGIIGEGIQQFPLPIYAQREVVHPPRCISAQQQSFHLLVLLLN